MPGKKKEKKSASKSQQRLFGMVTAYNKGDLKLDDLPASLAKKIKSIAGGSRKKTGDKRKNTKGITKKAAAELASTKHKGLPETVKESVMKFDAYINESQTIQPSIEDIEKSKLITDYPINGYDEEGVIGEVEVYDYKGKRYHIVQWFEHSEKGKKKEIHKVEEITNESVSTGAITLGDKPEGYMDALEGGESEGMTIEDIAKKHNVSVKYFEFILPSAIEIEMEHTTDAEVAARIALDHLVENPLYYDEEEGLPEMEEELEEMEEDEIEEIIADRLDKTVKKFDNFDDDDDDDDEEDIEEEIEEKIEKLEKIKETKVQTFEDFLNESNDELLLLTIPSSALDMMSKEEFKKYEAWKKVNRIKAELKDDILNIRYQSGDNSVIDFFSDYITDDIEPKIKED